MDYEMDEAELSWLNGTNDTSTSFSELVSLNVTVSLSVIYGVIFVTGILGNIMTCIVIGRNRSMHTDTNLYLLNIAISDLLLINGLPLEIYRLWKPFSYALSLELCIIMGMITKASANATVLTITAFTFERYIAICRPSMSHKTSSRAVTYIIGIWACALCYAVPEAMQFGILTYKENGQIISACTVKGNGIHQIFAKFSTIFFIVLVLLITVLYVLIFVKLHTSRVLHSVNESSVESRDRSVGTPRYRRGASQREVIRMLVAVALSFFLCWAPFHVQRLIAIYRKNLEQPTDNFYKIYEPLTSLSGVLYFLSTFIKPFLYIIMSNKFRDAFKSTLLLWCTRRERYRLNRTYSAMLAERRERAAAMVSQRPHNPRMLRRVSTASSQQCVAPPQVQARFRLETTHSNLLEEQKVDAAARPSQRPYNPRMLRQQRVAPPRAQTRFQLERTHSTLLEEQRLVEAAGPSQRPQNSRMLRQQRVAPPRAQTRFQLERTHSTLLEEQRLVEAAGPPQRPQNSRMLRQQRVAPPRAQSFNRSNLTIVIEESDSWLERQRLAEGSDSMTTSQSISNSNLRDVDQELSEIFILSEL